MTSLFPIRASFPLTPLQGVEGRTLVCLRRIGAMDVARITLNTDAEKVRPYIAAGSPIKITWSGNGVKDTFYGYVHTFNPIADGYLHYTMILAVSAAYPMFNEAQRTFYLAGIHNVAEEIADDHGFQLEVEPHSMTMDQILQQDDSDWRFLGRLADQWGYVLLMDGVTLTFRPLLDVLAERVRIAQDEKTQLSVSPNGSDIVRFEPSFSAVGDVAVTTTYAQGTRYVATEIPRQSTRPGIFEQVITSRSITTDLESEAVSVANEVRQRFPFVAKAKVLFPAGKKPLDCYRITHDGARMIWAVQQVKHVVTGDRYVADMVLGSDGADGTNSVKGVDIPVMVRKRNSVSRPVPVIHDFRPYFRGTKGDVLVKDQRWRAPVLYRREET